MDIQKRKLEFIKAFLKIQREEVIAQLEKILHSENVNIEREPIEPMTVEELHQRIEASMKDAQNDRIVESNELKYPFRP